MLKDKFKNHKIILASGSPRRQQFFKDLDLDFEIRIREIDEVYPESLNGEAITNYLAELKSRAFDNDIAENEIVITSDTLVWLNNSAIGKPKNYDEAFEILKSLSNATHEVFTSVCFLSNSFRNTFFDVTRVTFRKLTDEQIHYYLKNYKPFDKAGAYGIQEWIGLVGITKIDGSYSNVVGLPTEKVYAFLNDLKI